MPTKWARFSEPDNPWSWTPAVGWRSRNWEIIFRPDFHIVAGLARARRDLGFGRGAAFSYFLMYDDGSLGWARPEAVPQYVQRKAEQLSQGFDAHKYPAPLVGYGEAMGPEFDPSQERMFDEAVLMAVNEGRFYPRNPKKAGEWALKEYIRYKTEGMREDAKIIRAAVVREVQRQWMRR